MINEDTIKLLKECNAGIKMGVDSISDVMESVSDEDFKNLLSKCREEHKQLGSRTHELLNDYDDSGSEPNPIAKGMSWIKTNVTLTFNQSDSAVADLITDGCNMGVKSLNKYLNEYKAAEECAKDITKKLIKLEEKLTDDIKIYL